MTIPAEYHGQDPSSGLSPVAGSSIGSPISMHDFSPMDAFAPLSPFMRQQIPSGYMPMQFDHQTPPSTMELNPSHVSPLDHLEHKVDMHAAYDQQYASTSAQEEYNYSDFVHDEQQQQQHHQQQQYIPDNSSRETTVVPEYAQPMPMYQHGLVGILSHS